VTPHDHREIVPGCYRCELGRDEANDQLPDCPMCAEDGELHESRGDDGESFYVCAVCSGAFAADETVEVARP
jgi:hypothetical protein